MKTKEKILDNKFKERGIRKRWTEESRKAVLDAMDEYAYTQKNIVTPFDVMRKMWEGKETFNKSNTMKAIIKENKEKNHYPCLKISDKLIVLFIGNKQGVVISPDDIYATGHYHNSWDEKQFRAFNGTVELSND